MAAHGQVVIVTGANGSGKTTTCQTFVATAADLWLHFGADLFLGRVVPRQFVDGGPRCAEGVHMAPDDERDPEGPAHLALGAYGPAMIRTMHEMIAAASRAGQNLIVDHVTTTQPPLLQDCVERLKGLPVLFVALRPPDELLDQRVDRRMAHGPIALDPDQSRRANEATKRVARYVAREIFSHESFDLVIDNGTLSPREVVEAIRARLAKGPGTAFADLARRFHLRLDPFDSTSM
jgi:chloramphenicol 3-O-phosphotransferase